LIPLDDLASGTERPVYEDRSSGSDESGAGRWTADGPDGPDAGGGGSDSGSGSGSGPSVYRWDARAPPPSTAVVETVAEALDRDETTLPPLYDVVDPEVFDLLFDPPTGHARRRDVAVSFPYCGHSITVRGSGELEVRPE
jgi:hypothetical protein